MNDHEHETSQPERRTRDRRRRHQGPGDRTGLGGAGRRTGRRAAYPAAPDQDLSGDIDRRDHHGGDCDGDDGGKIAGVYMELGQEVFPPLVPEWLPEAVQQAGELLQAVFRPSLYGNDKLIEVLKSTIKDQTGDADLTLADLNKQSAARQGADPDGRRHQRASHAVPEVL